MAYLRFNTALKRIREVVEQSAGALRAVPVGRFLGDLPQGLDDESAMARAVSTPRVESSITSVTPSSSSPPVLGDLRIYEVQVSVKVLRVVTPLEQVSDADRDELQALAAQDADVLSQALGFPGNLARTAGGGDTEIVSGLLVYRSTSVLVGKRTDDGAQTITTTHVFRGHMLSRADVFVGTDFVLLIKTDTKSAGGAIQATPDNQFRFYGVGTYDIDWGDGTVDLAASGTQTHTYASPGTYQVRARNWSGVSRRYACPDSTTTDAVKILELQQWGTTQWTSCINMFVNCRGMVGTYRDRPNLSAPNSKSFDSMFRSCYAFNGSPYADMGSWDTSTVTSLARTFEEAYSFNQNINGWDISSVTTLFATFRNAGAFNSPLGSWDTSNVTTLEDTFRGVFQNTPTFFNQDIGSWNTSKVTTLSLTFNGNYSFNQNINDWDVSNVTNMFGTFARAGSFDQPLDKWNVSKVTSFNSMFGSSILPHVPFNRDISMWDTSSATDMNTMFFGAPFFNQDLSSWNVANVTNMSDMFRNANAFDQNLGSWVLNNSVILAGMLNTSLTTQGMNAENYSRTLIGWANERSATGNPNSRSLGATNRRYNATVYGGSPYDNGVSARANLVLATGSGGGGWTISGDAQI
jgi:surface protein